jgi:hypothetical protein
MSGLLLRYKFTVVLLGPRKSRTALSASGHGIVIPLNMGIKAFCSFRENWDCLAGTSD